MKDGILLHDFFRFDGDPLNGFETGTRIMDRDEQRTDTTAAGPSPAREKQPMPSMEWLITEACNYRCPYCNIQQQKKKRHASDAVVEAVHALMDPLPGTWKVKLIGGETTIHPRFLEICDRFTKRGHPLTINTNFSRPLETFGELVEVCGENLEHVIASLHLDQIGNLEEFVEKSRRFNEMKPESTEFIVSVVVTDDNFDAVRSCHDKLEAVGVPCKYLPIKEGGKYARYRDEQTEKTVLGNTIPTVSKTMNFDPYGTICHTGSQFFRIDAAGNGFRCYEPQPHFLLGNVADGSFRPYTGPRPCMARKCTCTVPANRNMIRFGETVSGPAVALSRISGWRRSLYPYARFALKRLAAAIRRDR